MNRMLGRLDHAQQRQQQFVSDASHELRSPVATSATMRRSRIAHPGSHYDVELAETVLAEDCACSVSSKTSSCSHAPTNADPAAAAYVDLDDLVFEEAQRLRSDMTSSRSTRPQSRPDGCAATPHCDECVVNLADNAVRHARTASR